MTKKTIFRFMLICLIPGLIGPVFSQQQLGVIKGRITDTEGFPLPGAYVYISSPSLIGIPNYVTTDTGNFSFPNLPPGTYVISIEMPGFKTANINDIPIHAGSFLTFTIKMEMSPIEEEITIQNVKPIINVQTAKLARVINSDLLKHIPLGRSFSEILKLAPGVLPEPDAYDPSVSVHGDTVRANAGLLDGLILNDPSSLALPNNINFDTVEEVEVVTAGKPAWAGPWNGGIFQIITKSGGNTVQGSLSLGFTGSSLSKSLWSQAEMSEKNTQAVPGDKLLIDSSFTLGGPILPDRAWFFGNAHYINYKQPTLFQSWIDPQGKSYNPYDWGNRDFMTFFKLSVKATADIKAQLLFNYTDRYRPVAETLVARTQTYDSTHLLQPERGYTGEALANVRLDQNSYVDLRAVYFSQYSNSLLQNDVLNSPSYSDTATGYSWGSADENRKISIGRLHAGATITRFQDGLLVGGKHEIKVGGEYEQSSAEIWEWKSDNLTMLYSNGSPYLFGQATSPVSGNTVGKGRISFSLAAATQAGLDYKNDSRRFSAFASDSVTFGDLVSLSLGLRFDRSIIQRYPIIKGAVGNAVAVKIGEDLISPLVGYNPYDIITSNETSDIFTWNSWSPRAGVSLDLFQNGATILRASWARMPESLGMQYSLALSPLPGTRRHIFNWYDENGDGKVDTDDTFVINPDEYILYDNNYAKVRYDPKLTAPFTTEWTVGLDQTLFRDFSMSLRAISKTQANLVENVLYSPDLDQYWYALTPRTQSWWVPFQTIVPMSGEYEDTPVTVYFPSKSAPKMFKRLTNVPELSRTYKAVELSFDKRMSHSWQLSGSLVLSQATGYAGLTSAASSGFSGVAATPNAFVNVNADSILDMDRPVTAKLMGTYKLPSEIYLSFLFLHSSGAPWARTVTVTAPEDWAESHDALLIPANVYLENPGVRRYPSRTRFDFRLEKEFTLKSLGKLKAYLDVFNVTGDRAVFQDMNDGGQWLPDAESTAKGTRVLNPNFKNYLLATGVRTFKLTLNFLF